MLFKVAQYVNPKAKILIFLIFPSYNSNLKKGMRAGLFCAFIIVKESRDLKPNKRD
jgi:hypothetical protein